MECGFRVEGSGFRVQGVGCAVEGFVLRLWSVKCGCRVPCSGFRVWGMGLRVKATCSCWSLGTSSRCSTTVCPCRAFEVSGLGFWVLCLRFGAWGLGYRVQGFGIRVSGFGSFLKVHDVSSLSGLMRKSVCLSQARRPQSVVVRVVNFERSTGDAISSRCFHSSDPKS